MPEKKDAKEEEQVPDEQPTMEEVEAERDKFRAKANKGNEEKK